MKTTSIRANVPAVVVSAAAAVKTAESSTYVAGVEAVPMALEVVEPVVVAVVISKVVVAIDASMVF